MDAMLQRFHMDTKLHELSMKHAKEKGMKLNNLNVFFEPTTWDVLTEMIESEQYVTPPCTQYYIDKNSGNHISYAQAQARKGKDVREINVLPLLDRVIRNAFYKIGYDELESWIDETCLSYKQGFGTRNAAKILNRELIRLGRYRGVKGDFSKFFDRVPIELIDTTFNDIQKAKPSKIWKPIIDSYHDNRIYINGELKEKYLSLRQGDPIACLLADIILRDVDAEMRKYDVIYYRYCDDFIIIGREYQKAFRKFKQMLIDKGIELNEKKTEYISDKEFFTFLGYRFQRNNVTVSKKTLKKICHKIKSETIFKCAELKRPLTDAELRKAIDNIQYYLFVGCKDHPNGMAGYLFGACNLIHDFEEIDMFAKDCIRAAKTNYALKNDNGYHTMYGLGCWHTGVGVIHKYGQNLVGVNNMLYYDLPRELGWYSLNHMYKKYLQGKEVYNMEIRKMRNGIVVETE